MKRKRSTDEQIAFALRQAESETAVEETEQSDYRWRREYGGLKTDQARPFKG